MTFNETRGEGKTFIDTKRRRGGRTFIKKEVRREDLHQENEKRENLT
jgi:hypothetical protein